MFEILKKFLSLGTFFAFLVNVFVLVPLAHADPILLPKPGAMLHLSPAFNIPVLKGIKIHPDNPFRFDFILDLGDHSFSSIRGSQREQLKTESTKLIKYFLTSLTLAEKDMWVNLSPYEQNRIMESDLAKTQMGRDMLVQDYILKQLTASLTYPEEGLGKVFWKNVYEKTFRQFGKTDIPFNAFNKVWIVADKVDVYERGNVAYIIDAHLKVMADEDYVAMNSQSQTPSSSYRMGAQIFKEIILPEIEGEVNQGRNFAGLRQMFYSMALSSWYKIAMKEALLNKIYGDQNKTEGLQRTGSFSPEEVYQQYLKAYKKGVFNYIKQDINPYNQLITPRKYFSGGLAVRPSNVLKRFQEIPKGADLRHGDLAMISGEGLPIKKRKKFDLKKTRIHIVRLFQRDHNRRSLPILKELSEALGPSRGTFFDYYEKILTSLESKTAAMEDEALKVRLIEAITAKRKEMTERKSSKKFDLKATVDHIIELFKNDLNRRLLPTARELSEALGPNRATLSNHYEEILNNLEKKATAMEDEALKARLIDAIPAKRKDMLERKNYKKFDFQVTIDHMIGLFQNDPNRRLLPSVEELSIALGLKPYIFSNNYRKILMNLHKKAEEMRDGTLKDRLIKAINVRNGSATENEVVKVRQISAIAAKPKKRTERKGSKFDLQSTLDHIIGLFQNDPNRRFLPREHELSKVFGLNRSIFSNNYRNILLNLQKKAAMTEDEGLKDRLIKAIHIRKGNAAMVVPGENIHRNMFNDRGYADLAMISGQGLPIKSYQKFDLKATVDHIIGLFQSNPNRRLLPVLKELSKALGPTRMTFSKHYEEIMISLKNEAEAMQDETLKIRLLEAIATKSRKEMTERKETEKFDLKATVDHSIGLFQSNPNRRLLPILNDLSAVLGPKGSTFFNHYEQILISLTNEAEAIKDEALKVRLIEAIAVKRKKMAERKETEKFDLKATVDYIIRIFQSNPDRLSLPILKELSADLGPNGRTFFSHYEEILISLKNEAEAIKDEALKVRLIEAIAVKRKKMAERKETEKFDLKATGDHIIGLFQSNPNRRLLPVLKELSKALGPNGRTFISHYEEILISLKNEAEAIKDEALKIRLIEAIGSKRKEMTERKEPEKVDLKATVEHIIGLFQRDHNRNSLPVVEKLSKAFGPTRMTFSKNYEKILISLTNEAEAIKDEALKVRLIEAIAVKRKKMAERKETEKFDLKATVDYIIRIFQSNPDRRLLPAPKELSQVLVPRRETFLNNYIKMLIILEKEVEAIEDQVLKNRLRAAIIIKRQAIHIRKGSAAMELSKALGPTGTTSFKHSKEILISLNNEAEALQDETLKIRLLEAIATKSRKEMTERKGNQKFDLKATMDHIIGLFQSNPNRRLLPTQIELSEALGPSTATFSNHYEEILINLGEKAEAMDNEALKDKLIDAIMAKRKELEVFNLQVTIDHIISQFQNDPNRRFLPSEKELSAALGLKRVIFSNNYRKVLINLQKKAAVTEDEELKDRLIKAINIRKSSPAMVVHGGIDFNQSYVRLNRKRDGGAMISRNMLNSQLYAELAGLEFHINSIVSIKNLSQIINLN